MADRRLLPWLSWFWSLILVLWIPLLGQLGWGLASMFNARTSTWGSRGAAVEGEHGDRDSHEGAAQLDDMRRRWESHEDKLRSLPAPSQFSPQSAVAGRDVVGQEPKDVWSQYPAALYCAQRLAAANCELREVINAADTAEPPGGTDLEVMARQIVALRQKQECLNESQRHLAKAQQILRAFEAERLPGRSAVQTVLDDLSERLEPAVRQIKETLEQLEVKSSEISNSLSNNQILSAARDAALLRQYDFAVTLLAQCKPPLPASYESAMEVSTYGQSAGVLLRESEQALKRWKTPVPDLVDLRERLETFCEKKPMDERFCKTEYERCEEAFRRIDALARYCQLTGSQTPPHINEWVQSADAILAISDEKLPIRVGIQATFRSIVEARLPDTKLAGSPTSWAAEYRETRRSLKANLGSKEHWLRYLAACERLQANLPRTVVLEEYSCKDEIDFSNCIVSDKCWPMVTRILAPPD